MLNAPDRSKGCETKREQQKIISKIIIFMHSIENKM